MVDVVCSELPRAGARVHADVSVRAGGSAVNAAVAAAESGASARVIGRIGNDGAGELVLAELARVGIAADLARDRELPSGTAVALADAVIAQRGANARFAVDDVPDTIDADALLVSGFALFQSGSADAARAAMERFTGDWLGVDVASPSLAPAALDADLANAIVFATAEETRAMTGAEPEEAAHALAARSTIACVKLGAEGAIAVQGSVLERRRAKVRAPESPFGAGDAFAGAFLVSLARGEPLGRALDRGNEAAAPR